MYNSFYKCSAKCLDSFTCSASALLTGVQSAQHVCRRGRFRHQEKQQSVVGPHLVRVHPPSAGDYFGVPCLAAAHAGGARLLNAVGRHCIGTGRGRYKHAIFGRRHHTLSILHKHTLLSWPHANTHPKGTLCHCLDIISMLCIQAACFIMPSMQKRQAQD